ncbi:hypothetical protein F5884DRAFT_700693 [Xylogone sp. PMI_703]|nr:hypothetical protein F5884DRAFT_700693 [Xylogone sp. PMI_703]
MAPKTHPQAQFVPIAPDLDIPNLVESCANFEYATRISIDELRDQSIEKLVYQHVILGGKPLVIDGWETSLHSDLFSPTFLQQAYSKKVENVRDIRNETNIQMTIGHYLKSMDVLTRQFVLDYRDPKRQLLYLKDIDTPPEWEQYLKNILPDFLFYLNDCVEPRTGGNGAIRELNEYGQWQFGKGVAPSGDLMSSLPAEMRAQNIMCYIGHEGTHTAAHKEMCASLGQNIMVEASKNGKYSKEGSSLWFMTETKDRSLVSEFFLSILGHDIEIEKHFAQVNAWKKAPFTVYVVEQRVGDLILIPPLAPHQVWNRGTRTMKVAWNRTCIDTLELATHEALPRGRMVCRDEQYKNKAIIYYTLLKYYNLLQRDTVESKMWTYGRIRQLLEDFKRLFALYTEILLGESFSPTLPEEDVEYIPYDSNVTCSYCRCNIFNRFLTCKGCMLIAPNGEEEAYDVCMDCYAMGRSCACISRLKWVEQWEWHTLAYHHEQWRQVVIQYNNLCQIQEAPPLPLRMERKENPRKTIAQICQEQLRLRPWHDPNKPPEPPAEPLEEELDDQGKPKKKKKGRMPPVKNKTHACHICCRQDWNWRLAFCTTCTRAYCYGVLWRAFDLMPQDVMASPNWRCPKCLGICSCGACRKIPSQKPYIPKGTLLGHDTIKFADYRSVESLVDFSKTNLTWLREDGGNDPKQSNRIIRLQEKANAQKAREADMDSEDFNEYLSSQLLAYIDGRISEQDDLLTIDPLLQEAVPPVPPSQNDENPGNLSQTIESGPLLQTEHATTVNGRSNPQPDSHTTADVDGSYAADYGDQWRRNGMGANYAPVANMYSSEPVRPNSSHVPVERGIGIGYYNQTHGADMILYEFAEIGVTPDNTVVVQPAVVGDVVAPTSTPAAKKRKRLGSEEQDEYSPDDRRHDGVLLSQEPRGQTRALRERRQQPNNHDTSPPLGTDGESEVEIVAPINTKAVGQQTAGRRSRSTVQSVSPAQNRVTGRISGEVESPAPSEIPKRKRGRPRVSNISSSVENGLEPNGSGPSRLRHHRSSDALVNQNNESTPQNKAKRGRPPGSTNKRRLLDDTPAIIQRRTRNSDVNETSRQTVQHSKSTEVRVGRKETSVSGRRGRPSLGLKPLVAVELRVPREKIALRDKVVANSVSKPSADLEETTNEDGQLPEDTDADITERRLPTVAGTFTDTGREPSYNSLFDDSDGSSSDASIPARVSK